MKRIPLCSVFQFQCTDLVGIIIYLEGVTHQQWDDCSKEHRLALNRRPKFEAKVINDRIMIK